jgi:hypothetical protein
MVIQNWIKGNHFVYFIYHVKHTNWSKFISDLSYVSKSIKLSKFYLLLSIFYSSLRFGNSFYEYLYYGFHNVSLQGKKLYALSGYMYEYQLKMNPRDQRYLLEDKMVFLKKYKEFIGREWLDLNISDIEEISAFIKGKSKVVLKNSKGQAGNFVKIIDLQYFTSPSLFEYSKNNNFDLLEEFVFQHKTLMDLAPNSLNTLRIITQINNQEKVKIIGTILRLGYDRETDNISTGGLACSFDPGTGIVNTNGISFDISKPDFLVHPVSGKILKGFQIPYWRESIEMARKAALLFPQNRSVGWDIAIKNEGPILIEGNHNWGARIWQMPVKQGLKPILIEYCK